MAPKSVSQFIRARRTSKGRRLAVSLFSGAGIADTGVEAGGFQIVAQVESNARRLAVANANFPVSLGIAAKVEESLGVVQESLRGRDLDLLVATPPCQGMSSSNPTRGKRGSSQAEAVRKKNALLLETIPYITRLQPRMFLAENVRAVLTAPYSEEATVLDELISRLPRYRVWATPVNVADYGVPQDRRRALIVGIHRDEPVVAELESSGLAPWPRATHGPSGVPWVTISEWLQREGYEELDAGPNGIHIGTHPLHKVPRYDAKRYQLVSDIPAGSGRSGYENEKCPTCHAVVPFGEAVCNFCSSAMYNRPIVQEADGRCRLIRGFRSSYRRMPGDHPAPTITTNTSHIGSDFKIHPTENRVLSILECADLQTVPRWFDYSYLIERKLDYLSRVIIGEAFPPYVAFRVCETLNFLLSGSVPANLSEARVARLGHRTTRKHAFMPLP